MAPRKHCLLACPDTVDCLVTRLAEEPKREGAEREMASECVKHREPILEAEMTRLMQAVAEGLDTNSIRAALLESEKEVTEIESKLEQNPCHPDQTNELSLRAFVTAKLGDIRGILGETDNVTRARMLLEGQIQEIVLEPVQNKEGSAYLATGKIESWGGDQRLRWFGAAGRS